jgi:putative N6-adenine-specific DNA methylase
VTAPGLETVTAGEMRALGIAPTHEERGGLGVEGTAGDLYTLNLHLRTASRVLVRLAEFRATSFGELERRAAGVAWARVLAPGVRPTFQVTCRKSRLYHSGAVEERLARFAHASERAGAGGIPGAGAPSAPEQRFVVRLVRDRLTVSADASGEHLHRRGYREATAKAPLRETLAAAALLASGWSPDEALVDPLCGSGTLAVEGALMARRIPPGWRRGFAFQQWPGFEADTWARLRAEAEARMSLAAHAPILASDRDAGAVRFAAENAARAGVADDVVFRRAALSDARPPEGWSGGGWLVANPPWGRRVGERGPLRDLYARLGQLARARFPGWGLAVLTATPELAGHVGAGGEVVLSTRSGGVPVALHRFGAERG